MTLSRLALAWLPVAILFWLVDQAARRFAAPIESPPPLHAWKLGWTPIEAGLLTLFASLWFDTLGSGGWWVLFLLIGLLVGGQRLTGAAAAPRWWIAADALRYVAGGALLAWRLG